LLVAPIVLRLLRCNGDDVIALTRLFSVGSGALKKAHASQLLGVKRDVTLHDVTGNAPAENVTLLNNILLGANIMMSELWSLRDYSFTTDEVAQVVLAILARVLDAPIHLSLLSLFT
jgi:hypothetical protein